MQLWMWHTWSFVVIFCGSNFYIEDYPITTCWRTNQLNISVDLLCKGFTIGFFGFLFFPSLNSKEEEQRNKLFALLNLH